MIINMENKMVKYEDCFIAPAAVVCGSVTIGENSSVWYGAVVRGDDAEVIIGKNSNVQDNAVIHVNPDCPAVIGDYVSIGHGSIIHGCKIGDNTVIGMGAVVMDGAEIGKNCVIGAGTLITSMKKIPDNSMVFGSPFKIVRSTTGEECEHNTWNAVHYSQKALEHKKTVEKNGHQAAWEKSTPV